jgi:predicted transglutaminase-like protease
MENFNLKNASETVFSQWSNYEKNKKAIKDATVERDSGLIGAFSHLAYIGTNLDLTSKDNAIRKEAKTEQAHILAKIEDKFSVSSREVAQSFMNKFNKTYRKSLVLADGGEHNTVEFILEIFVEENLKSWDSFRNYQNVVVEEKLDSEASQVFDEILITFDKSDYSDEIEVFETDLKKLMLKLQKMKAKKQADLIKEAEQAVEETKKQAKPKELAMVA